MDTNPTTTSTTHDIEHAPYTPLPDHPSPTIHHHRTRRPLKVFATTFASTIFLLSLVALIINNNQSQEQQVVPLVPQQNNNVQPSTTTFSSIQQEPRGVAQGVSAKSSPSLNSELAFNWTNAMFSWQRTAFHFQPAMNWMNDPNGPMYYKGWYHLFYQYNPDSAVWGNITWGHAVSKDLIHWLYLPLAMVPDQWYDINGVWTGSATLLPNGQIVILYTGDTNETVQVQNLAYPANLSDPLLIDWLKYPDNPVITPPTGIGSKNFRDPTTAWVGPNNTWHIAVGSKINKTGLAMVFRTTDFMSYELVDGYLHEVPGTGMWECIDFYPVAVNGSKGLDTSSYGPGVKHVLKASLDDTKVDHYAIGTYNMSANKWKPDNPYQDVGVAWRYDYGRYYASKTFYDQHKQRRILWGWINETDSEYDDLEKGWASVQTIPRSVLFDNKTGASLLQWPVDELETLRLNSTEFEDVLVEPGSVVPLDIGTATQLDIYAEFETTLITTNTTTEEHNCSGGATDRSTLGPFGLLVLADETVSELTPIFFRQVNTSDDGLTTYFCADETRSSLAPDVAKTVYGSTVPVLEDENFHMRVIVDHSIVESFAQGGRTVITSRVYPTEAIYGNARLFLFNNATGVSVKATLKVWELNSAFIHPFPLDQY